MDAFEYWFFDAYTKTVIKHPGSSWLKMDDKINSLSPFKLNPESSRRPDNGDKFFPALFSE